MFETLDRLFAFAQIIIWVVGLIYIFFVIPARVEENKKMINGLNKRIKHLENPNEEKGSPIFRDEPDWLR